MLTITIDSVELYNPIKEEFTNTKERQLILEHSLVSISKWESIWKKPFLSKDQKSDKEILDYIRCMTISKNVDDEVYNFISNKNMIDIRDYIDDPMTATIINQESKANKEIITSELIYYWLVAMQIPFECQKWNLNRLLTLVNICNIKNAPPKKMSRRDIVARNKKLNDERRAKMNSNG